MSGEATHMKDERGSHATGYIIEQIALGTEHTFKQATEHPQREHIEEHMRNATGIVHEHIGDELRRIEIGGSPEMQAQPVLQVNARCSL